MTPLRTLEQFLRTNTNPDAYLFTIADLEGLVPQISRPAWKMVLNRTVKTGLLVRVCRGIYLYEAPNRPKGRELYHVAGKIRNGDFTYLSQESVLSDLGIISQVPLQRITVMTTGRSGLLSCGPWGTVEFTHTKKKPETLMDELTYDSSLRLYRASASLAWQDLKAAGRNLDLVDQEALLGHIL
jgi:hypothetical protein